DGRGSLDDLRARLAADGVAVSDPLGFDDSYALAVTRESARRLGLRTISDLARHGELRGGFTHEFLGRADGWPGLPARYGISLAEVRGMQHELAFDALASGAVDVVDAYTTDAQVARLDLALLKDDLAFFPQYQAVILYRLDLARRAPAALEAIRSLVSHV